MQQIVEEYLAKCAKEKAEKEKRAKEAAETAEKARKEQKNALILKFSGVGKKYLMPEECEKVGYHNCRYDYDTNKYYVPADVSLTDEEYEAIYESFEDETKQKIEAEVAASDKAESLKAEEKKQNTVASVLRIIGIICIAIGLIDWIFIAKEYNGTIGFAVFIIMAVDGVLFFGFSEVIRLLHEINLKQ